MKSNDYVWIAKAPNGYIHVFSNYDKAFRWFLRTIDGAKGKIELKVSSEEQFYMYLDGKAFAIVERKIMDIFDA